MACHTGDDLDSRRIFVQFEYLIEQSTGEYRPDVRQLVH
jgi:hypothetical protein